MSDNAHFTADLKDLVSKILSDDLSIETLLADSSITAEEAATEKAALKEIRDTRTAIYTLINTQINARSKAYSALLKTMPKGKPVGSVAAAPSPTTAPAPATPASYPPYPIPSKAMVVGVESNDGPCMKGEVFGHQYSVKYSNGYVSVSWSPG
jgi:hypothetical protein